MSLPKDAFQSTGTPPVEASPLDDLKQEPPALLVALEDHARPLEVPDTLPVLDDPASGRSGARPAGGVPLSEALRQAVYTPTRPAPKAPGMAIPEVRVGDPLPRPAAPPQTSQAKGTPATPKTARNRKGAAHAKGKQAATAAEGTRTSQATPAASAPVAAEPARVSEAAVAPVAAEPAKIAEAAVAPVAAQPARVSEAPVAPVAAEPAKIAEAAVAPVAAQPARVSEAPGAPVAAEPARIAEAPVAPAAAQPAEAAKTPATPEPAKASPAPTPTELPDMHPSLAARTLRGLRRLENTLLSAIGKGDPVLDLQDELDSINQLGPQMQSLSDEELKGRTAEFRARLAEGESLDDLRVEAYAVAREAAFRTTGMRPFDVQVLGALALGQNQIAEMKTGEGKTLTEVLPVYLNALSGQGVHVVTVNETLAERDCQWMGPVFQSLGMTVGLVKEEMSPEQRRAGYNSDITYMTNSTLGFDYLRDQTVQDPKDRVQRPPFFALVDEVDEILIDEARTPLILSARDRPAEGDYRKFAKIVSELSPGVHYQVDRKKNQAWATDEGVKLVEAKLGVDNLYSEENVGLVPHLQKALEARGLFVRDRDYVVQDGKLMIVDEFTGRVLEDRRYNDGLHQALEAREGLEIQPEQRTLASITYPNLFRRYPRLAGMSGTAKTEEKEFQALYGLPVVPIPTNKPVARVDEPDIVFRTQQDKFAAILDNIEDLFCEGQPVLVGTRSIQVNEYLSQQLAARGIPHQILNAKSVKDNTAAENEILAGAGRSGMVTLATNMAGRGVDIKPDMVNYKKLAIELSERAARGEAVVVDLGKPKEAEELGRWLEMGQIPTTTVTAESPAPQAGEVQMRVGVEAPAPPGVSRLQGSDYPTGGLFVIGTERHDSRRIDDQLRGRAGRQGQVGGSRFYLSFEDDLVRHFGGSNAVGIMDRLGVPRNKGVSDPLVAKLVRSAQEAVEQQHFSIRKDTTKYDQVLNKHREVFYADRDRIVEGEDLREQVLDWGAAWLAGEVLGDQEPEKRLKPEFVAERLEQVGEELGVPLPQVHLEQPVRGRELAELLRPELESRYRVLEERFGADALREQERWMTLQTMDRCWSNHLDALAELQQGVGLVAYGQEDPWIAYQEKAFEQFSSTKEEIVRTVAQDLFGEVLREVPQPPPPSA